VKTIINIKDSKNRGEFINQLRKC